MQSDHQLLEVSADGRESPSAKTYGCASWPRRAPTAASYNPSRVAPASYETCPGGRKLASRDRVFLDSAKRVTEVPAVEPGAAQRWPEVEVRLECRDDPVARGRCRRRQPVFVRDVYAEEIMKTTISFAEGITGWATRHREAVLSNQAHLDPRVGTVPGTPLEPESLICVPLIARGQIKGVLNLYREGEGVGFTGLEFEIAKRFGDAVALALDNAVSRARLEHQARTDPSPASSTTASSTNACDSRCRNRAGRMRRSRC